jgi:hypothetical protein
MTTQVKQNLSTRVNGFCCFSLRQITRLPEREPMRLPVIGSEAA